MSMHHIFIVNTYSMCELLTFANFLLCVLMYILALFKVYICCFKGIPGQTIWTL